MAITIQQSPGAISPAANPLIFFVSSTNTGQPNFRFIAEIKNSGGSVLAKKKFPIIPGTTKGWIDIHRTLENYVTHDFDISLITGAESSSSWFEYSVSFGEEYGSSPAEYLGLAGSGALRIWNGSLQTIEEFPDFDPADYLFDSAGSSGIWLSAFGSSKRIDLDQRDFLSFMCLNTAGPDQIEIAALSSGGATTTSRYNFPALGSGRRVYRFPSGPENLNLIASLATGTPGAVIPANTISYTIRLRKSGANFGPAFSYQIRSSCSIYPVVDCFFLNRFGAFESFRFNRRSDIKREISRRQYDKPLIIPGASSAGYLASAGSRTNYHTEISKSIRIFSDWISESESDGLIDLASAPIAYLWSDGNLREVAIDLKEISDYRKVNEKLRSFELSAEYSSKDRRQSR